MSFFNKILGVVNRCPKVAYIQPKLINLYFSNSINNKYSVLNLAQYDRYDFEILSKQDDKENIFVLVVNLYKDKLETYEISSFETRKEAEDALLSIRNKLYSTEKTVLKSIFILILLSIVYGTFIDVSRARDINNMPVGQTNLISEADLAQYQAQIQNLKQQQLQQMQPTQAPQEPSPQLEQSSNPEVNSFLNKLN